MCSFKSILYNIQYIEVNTSDDTFDKLMPPPLAMSVPVNEIYNYTNTEEKPKIDFEPIHTKTLFVYTERFL